MASTRLPTSMRAAQWTHVSSTLDKALHINPSAPLPLAKGSKTPTQLPPKHTLVRVAYASVNPIDIKLPALPIVGRLMFHKPATPGLDFSGTVVATSSDGTLAPGTRVYGKLNYPAGGALAEYLLVDSHKATICPLPDGVSLRDAGVLGTATAAAYHGIVPYLQPGQHVLINGASGGVGTIAVQFAKAIGCRVTAVCSGANADMVRRLGADEVIDYRQEQPAAQLKRLGAQFDHIFDAAYHDTSLYYQAHHYLKAGGQYVNIAGNVSLKGLKDFLVPTLLPSWLGGGQRKLVFFHGDATLESLTRVAQWVAEKKVQPVIDQQYNLEDISAAYRQLATGRSKGKIAIKISDDQ